MGVSKLLSRRSQRAPAERRLEIWGKECFVFEEVEEEKKFREVASENRRFHFRRGAQFAYLLDIIVRDIAAQAVKDLTSSKEKAGKFLSWWSKQQLEHIDDDYNRLIPVPPAPMQNPPPAAATAKADPCARTGTGRSPSKGFLQQILSSGGLKPKDRLFTHLKTLANVDDLRDEDQHVFVFLPSFWHYTSRGVILPSVP